MDEWLQVQLKVENTKRRRDEQRFLIVTLDDDRVFETAKLSLEHRQL